MAKRTELTRGQQALVDAKALVIKSAGLGECSQLCDVAQIEHVCELVEDELTAAAVSGLPGRGTAEALRTLLVLPLQNYLATLRLSRLRNRAGVGVGLRMETFPTIELIQAAENVCVRLQFGPCDRGPMREDALCLRNAWFRWAAYVASYWVTDKVPELLARTIFAASSGHGGGIAFKEGPARSSGTRAAVLAEVALLEGKVEPDQVAKQVANKVGRDVSLVHRYMRESKK